MRRCHPRALVCGATALLVLAFPAKLAAQCRVTAQTAQTQVIVSAREARIRFPCDSTFAWGGRRPAGVPIQVVYSWGVFIDAVSGPTYVSINVRDPGLATDRLPTLDTLVRLGNRDLSRENETRFIRAAAEEGRLVLWTRDRATIARLFGLRPGHVRVTWRNPARPPEFRPDSVPVTYVSPPIPPPTPALLAHAARNTRRHEASITTRWYRISADPRGGFGGELWLPIGDSLELSVRTTECQYDACVGAARGEPGVRWSILDGDIATLTVRPSGDDWRGPRVVLHGRRPGRTTVVARLPRRGMRDTVLSESLLVVPRVRRVVLMPRDTVAPSADTMTIRAVIFGDDGTVLDPAPADIEHLGNSRHSSPRVHGVTAPVTLHFERAGRHRLIATLRGHADTLDLLVRPARIRQGVIPEPRALEIRVLRDADAAPVVGAQVTVAALGQSAPTDSTGRAFLALAPVGPLRMEIAKTGYETRAVDVTVPEGHGLYVELSLAERPSGGSRERK